MEHHNVYARALIFTLLHWMNHLGSQMAKASAQIRLDKLIDTTLTSRSLVTIVSAHCQAGTVSTEGVAITYHSRCILNVQDAVSRFPRIKKATGNEHRLQLVGVCPIPCKCIDWCGVAGLCGRVVCMCVCVCVCVCVWARFPGMLRQM